MAHAHPEFLQHVVDLLLANAVKAIEQSERKQIKVCTREALGWAEILISDTGLGIPANVLANIFKNPILKPEGENGLGMGPLIAATIIRQYGGEIYVEKTSIDGTTILIRLPLNS